MRARSFTIGEAYLVLGATLVGSNAIYGDDTAAHHSLARSAAAMSAAVSEAGSFQSQLLVIPMVAPFTVGAASVRKAATAAACARSTV